MADGGQKGPRVPPPSPEEEKVLLPSAPNGDDTGTQETKQLTRGLPEKELRKEAAKREHDRSERFRDHFENVAICSLWIIAFVLFAVGGTWFWHLLTPGGWHYLDTEQVTKLQNIVTGGIAVGIMSAHIKKRMG